MTLKNQEEKNIVLSGSQDLNQYSHGPIETPLNKNHLEVPQFIVGIAQSVGMQRDVNEDALITLTSNLISNNNGLQFGLYIIADGMGGHENGEVASNIAVRILLDQVLTQFYKPIISLSANESEFSVQEIIRMGMLQAHQIIKKEAVGGGSTLTAALLLGRQMTIGHIGDSRAYLFSLDGRLKQLTKDHSIVKRLEEIGQISSDQASTHPQRNYLYRAVGQGDALEPDIATYQLEPASQLILCSDGLWGVISEKDLIVELQSSAEPQYICQSLVDKANAAGGPDNISVIIVRIPE